MLTELLISAVVSLISVLFAGRLISPLLVRAGLIAQDINKTTVKKEHPKLPTGGGLILMVGIFVGVLVFIASMNFFTNASVNSEYLLLGLLSIIAASFVGFMDDITGSQIRTSHADVETMAKNYSLFNGGIKQWQKPLLTLIAALPLMAANFGTRLVIPYLGTFVINPVIYILFLVPIGVVFLSNSFNMLEGLNGLSLQMSMVAFAALAIFAYHTGAYTAFSLAVLFFASAVGYTYYGLYPAKLLPGDSLTYMLGGGMAAVIILGDMGFVGIILAIPWILEFLLKARRRFHAHSWGILQKNGRLTSPHGRKIYSLTHLFLRTGKFKEWQIVQMFTVVEIIIAAIALFVAW